MRFIFLSLLFANFTFAQISDFKSVDFALADHIANINKGASLNNIPALAYNLTNKLDTDVEKFRAIYTWVCNNVKADIKQENKIFKKKRKYKNDSLRFLKWNNYYLKTVFSTLLKEKETMCTGYAYLIKELAYFANIKCEIINGYGRSVISNVNQLEIANHSWNAVKLNEKWYLCDATWSSGYTIGNLFINDYNDGYFLTDPELFSKSHYPIQEKWLLTNESSTSEFVSSPLVYSETFQHKIIPISPKKMIIRSKSNCKINFQFKSLTNSENLSVSLIKFNGNKLIPFEINDLKHHAGNITFNCVFKRKGYYDVHLKVNNDIVATYVVQIS